MIPKYPRLIDPKLAAVSVVIDALKGMACLRRNTLHGKDYFLVSI